MGSIISLAAVNPRMITGFGQTGPYAHRAGYNFIIQRMDGIMSMTGEPDGPPQKCGVAYPDLFTGTYRRSRALRRRDVTGQGAHIDMVLLNTQVAVIAGQALNWMTSDNVPHASAMDTPTSFPIRPLPARTGTDHRCRQ
ncbi:CoA transferase [Sphingopyxis panaciterrulae]|uniref:Crotonobetainyl-CoA:carnitine CoA-transferase CaiB-like acyl-CoA transferase n=1 Tax=Sphingopyxis panaciterrulae TaxID=462372 RepID=A0A7W9ESZ3_9SPHN|nr:CoA transferase [Sphingopyxis panaciterrulae]MBB5707670.1 crotonobetainyl-CoA:carnitine CoA-transferase CaiB-like acyl-CoA transferase [Sphingopyxis panaciterrulae]